LQRAKIRRILLPLTLFGLAGLTLTILLVTNKLTPVIGIGIAIGAVALYSFVEDPISVAKFYNYEIKCAKDDISCYKDCLEDNKNVIYENGRDTFQ
jgi:hypothetical protein